MTTPDHHSPPQHRSTPQHRTQRRPGVSPLLLRLAVATVFLWAGWGKLMTDTAYGPAAAATLTNLGASPFTARHDAAHPPSKAATPAAADTETANPETAPAAGQGPSGAPDAATPETANPDTAAPVAPDTQTPAAETPKAEPGSRPEPVPETDRQPDPAPPAAPPALARTGARASAQRNATADDFAEPVTARRLYGVAITLHAAASPLGVTSTQDGIAVQQSPRRMLHRAIASGPWPVRLAWVAAGTELLCGLCLLLGALTRLAAMGLLGVMGTAAWLTSVGPVVTARAQGTLGFLPAIDNFAPEAWSQWLLQLVTMAACAALVCLGSGAMGIDRIAAYKRTKPRATAAGTAP